MNERPKNDPLKAYRFEFGVCPKGGVTEYIPMMEVSGLTLSSSPGMLYVSRGVVPGPGIGHLSQWFAKRDARDVYVTADGGIQWHLTDVIPTGFQYSDLDSGENRILLETMTLQYGSCRVYYIDPPFTAENPGTE